MDFYKQRYCDKKLAILGFGREGRSSYQFLRQQVGFTGEITIIDEDLLAVSDWQKNNPDPLVKQLQFSTDMAIQLNQFDLIFRTPGFSCTKLVGVDDYRLTSQTNEFLLTQGKHTIGITGTKGKSTTSSLVLAVLSRLGLRVKMVGNIGQPALDLLTENNDVDWYVYEISSFQAENISCAPAIGVVINIFEEHLDHYANFEQYISAKMKLISSMGQKLAIYGCDNQLLKTKRALIQAESVRSFGLLENRLTDAGIYLDDQQIVKIDEAGQKNELMRVDFGRKMLGRHNLINALVALLIADYLVGLTNDNLLLVQQAIAEFNGLEHRLEYVGNFRGVDFYNDSISTIPEAMEQGIEAIDNVQTVIIGGQDRGIHRQQMIEYLNQRPNLKMICLPDTGHRIFDQLTNEKYRVDNLDQAVKIAYQITDAGQACLLSPASPSYGFFKNFEDRGRQFKQLVKRF
ncbi:MAG: UDP-N-acetylmuramoyl-L-alanine--D-glutamate ligase [Candidatus Saccharibacteria bacterium]|nr:UDP-N-acetylmuramoyl-L-alanine--D-glutamate ligase [Candidatus Saccharibacteria bacterium]